MTDSNDALAELLTLTLTVDQWGTRRYRNSLGELHRIHGPAIERANGYKSWWLNGRLYRTTGPAIDPFNGYKAWYLNGKHLTEREFHKRFDDVTRIPL